MTNLARLAILTGAAALFAGCGGGSQPPIVAPSSAELKLQHVARPPNLSAPRYATVLPDRSVGKKFEYVFNAYGAGIFNYPKSTQQIGSIAARGGQGCTNVLYGYGKKIFWDVASEYAITEYKVLDRPIKTLSDSIGTPSSCAMNTSGDLAVGILDGSGAGDVVIYKNASGSGTAFTTPLVDEFFDGYDNRGNLFADGFNSTGFFALVELPKGSSTFQTIATSNTVQFPGSVQWDGKYLTVFDQEANAMYRYAVSGATATLKGTVFFSGSSDCGQTWIVPGLVYCADAGNNSAEVFAYPAGGSAIAVLSGNFNFPLGVVAAKR